MKNYLEDVRLDNDNNNNSNNNDNDTENGRRKMTLNQMYGWIRENFAFYRTGDQCWQVRCGMELYGMG